MEWIIPQLQNRSAGYEPPLATNTPGIVSVSALCLDDQYVSLITGSLTWAQYFVRLLNEVYILPGDGNYQELIFDRNVRINIYPLLGIDAVILSSRDAIPGINELQVCDRECRVPAI